MNMNVKEETDETLMAQIAEEILALFNRRRVSLATGTSALALLLKNAALLAIEEADDPETADGNKEQILGLLDRVRARIVEMAPQDVIA